MTADEAPAVERPAFHPRWEVRYHGDARGEFAAQGPTLPAALAALEAGLFRDVRIGHVLPPDRAVVYLEMRELLRPFAENRAQRRARTRLIVPGGGPP